MNTQQRRRRAGAVWLFCVFTVFISACGRPDPGQELDAAVADFSAGDYQEAALRLNYVVQVDPENVRARELRGDIALALGDYATAVSEFVYVRELGRSPDFVALRLAEAYIAQREIDSALGVLDASEEELADELMYWILRAEAMLTAGRVPEAEILLERAREVGDGDARILTTGAQITFAGGDSAEAFNLLEQALLKAPDDPRVRVAYAEILAQTGRLTEATAELERAADFYHEASLGPRETSSLLGLVQLYLARSDLDAAEAVAARLAERAPQVQWTSYFQGVVMFRRGDYDEAAAMIQPLVNAFPETTQFRSLLGAIQLARGNVGQAEQQFLRVLAVSPRDPAAAKLLAETRLRQQRPDAALDALLAVQDLAVEDPQIGLLSGIATIRSGNAEQGLLYLEQAAALDPTNEHLKLQLARAYLATGRDEEASRLLTGTFGDDGQVIEADLLRLFAEMRRGDAGSTSEIARALIADYPNDPRVLTAVAVHYQLNGEASRARDMFERAAKYETDGAIARMFVAASLTQEGRQDEAESLLRQTIQQQPANAQVMAGLAQLLAGRGEFDEAAELFERAAGNTPSVNPRIALAQMRLRQGNVREAKRQLDLAAAAAPDNPEVIALSGVVALAEGRPDDAVALLERAAPMLPDRLGVTVALARARLANGQAAAARDMLLDVIELAPRSLPIRLTLGYAELQSGNIDGALSVAIDLKVAFPAQAGGYVLEGRALMEARQYAAASKSLAAAFERQPTWSILTANIQALRLAGRPAEALDAIAAWLAANPGHIPAGLMRAVLLQAAGNQDEALNAYMTVIDLDPRNLVALNNAAWILYELEDSDALALAKRAYDVDPENASVLDTLGWILLDRGQVESAIEKLSRASKLAPQSAPIRYHLAAALVAGGQSARAREMLVALLAEERDFDGRVDAERLLESLRVEVALDS